ncbi:MAG: hypothetical protein LBM98_08705 [Oscillospiraceae bacterium]|nr:hypothetical protein [Oscillospiraceae bacterium]
MNQLGKSRVEEYIGLLAGNPLFAEFESFTDVPHRYIRLYDTLVAAGLGNFFDSDTYQDLEVDDTMPDAAGFAVRISGDRRGRRDWYILIER